MGQLRVISDHVEGTFVLPDKPWKIGRGKDCDIQLVHKSISRHHCIVTQRDGELRIEDLGSTYGSHVNGTQMTDGYARYGDKIRLGRILLVFEAETPTGVFQRSSSSIPPPPEPAAEIPVAQVVESPAPAPAAPRTAPPSQPTPPPPAPTAPSLPAAEKPEFKLAPSQPAPAPRKKPEPPKWSLAEQRAAEAAKASQAAEAALTPDEIHRREIDRIESAPTTEKPAAAKAVGGAFSRLQGGHVKKKKAAKSDYTAEASEWEDQVAEMEEGAGPDYAAEAEDWEKVWGKEKKRKGFMFSGANPLAGFFGLFGGLSLKARMVVVFGVMVLIAGLANIGYEKATAQILVPKRKARTNPSTGTDRGDKALDKAVDTFKKIIPKELQDNNPDKGTTPGGKKDAKKLGEALKSFKKLFPDD